MLDGGPLIILVLGMVAGGVIHLFLRRFWVAVGIATVASAAVWVGGCYLLFFLMAPSELGPPALVSILLTLVTAFAGALIAGGVVRGVREVWGLRRLAKV